MFFQQLVSDFFDFLDILPCLCVQGPFYTYEI